MNRSELVEKVADVTGLEKDRAEKAVMAFIDTVKDAIKADGKVSIFGFGTFNPTARAARLGRNPQTGAPVKIAASKGVRFAPAAAFKLALNSRPAKKGAAAKKSAAAASAPAAKKSAPAAKKSAP
ncbi:MAG: HU family DNA-binding protein, partial [Actinomycetota bacterium]|nr:HU family DNA-binding protein [Actinomycetota bacterium]